MASDEWVYCAHCGHRDEWHEVDGCCVIKSAGSPRCGCRNFAAESPIQKLAAQRGLLSALLGGPRGLDQAKREATKRIADARAKMQADRRRRYVPPSIDAHSLTEPQILEACQDFVSRGAMAQASVDAQLRRCSCGHLFAEHGMHTSGTSWSCRRGHCACVDFQRE